MTRPLHWALGVLGVTVVLGGGTIERAAQFFGQTPAPAAAAAGEPGVGSVLTVTLHQDLAGHYTVHPLVEGRRVRMMVDTGATLCAFTQDDAERAGSTETLTQHFPLPTVSTGEHYNYPNSQGLRYQIEEVEKCLAEGRIESEEYTHAEMLTNAATMQEARQQIGLLFESEAAQQPQQAQPLVEGLELWSSSERLAELAGEPAWLANLVTEKEAGARSASL